MTINGRQWNSLSLKTFKIANLYSTTLPKLSTWQALESWEHSQRKYIHHFCVFLCQDDFSDWDIVTRSIIFIQLPMTFSSKIMTTIMMMMNVEFFLFLLDVLPPPSEVINGNVKKMIEYSYNEDDKKVKVRAYFDWEGERICKRKICSSRGKWLFKEELLFLNASKGLF